MEINTKTKTNTRDASRATKRRSNSQDSLGSASHQQAIKGPSTTKPDSSAKRAQLLAQSYHSLHSSNPRRQSLQNDWSSQNLEISGANVHSQSELQSTFPEQDGLTPRINVIEKNNSMTTTTKTTGFVYEKKGAVTIQANQSSRRRRLSTRRTSLPYSVISSSSTKHSTDSLQGSEHSPEKRRTEKIQDDRNYLQASITSYAPTIKKHIKRNSLQRNETDSLTNVESNRPQRSDTSPDKHTEPEGTKKELTKKHKTFEAPLRQLSLDSRSNTPHSVRSGRTFSSPTTSLPKVSVSPTAQHEAGAHSLMTLARNQFLQQDETQIQSKANMDDTELNQSDRTISQNTISSPQLKQELQQESTSVLDTVEPFDGNSIISNTTRSTKTLQNVTDPTQLKSDVNSRYATSLRHRRRMKRFEVQPGAINTMLRYQREIADEIRESNLVHEIEKAQEHRLQRPCQPMVSYTQQEDDTFTDEEEMNSSISPELISPRSSTIEANTYTVTNGHDEFTTTANGAHDEFITTASGGQDKSTTNEPEKSVTGGENGSVILPSSSASQMNGTIGHSTHSIPPQMIPYVLQGNMKHYTMESMVKRQQLKHSWIIQSWLTAWWHAAKSKLTRHTFAVTQKTYVFIMSNLYLVLTGVAGGASRNNADFSRAPSAEHGVVIPVAHESYADALAIAELDWQRDQTLAVGEQSLPFLAQQPFEESMFELADLWCDSADEKEYCQFLAFTLAHYLIARDMLNERNEDTKKHQKDKSHFRIRIKGTTKSFSNSTNAEKKAEDQAAKSAALKLDEQMFPNFLAAKPEFIPFAGIHWRRIELPGKPFSRLAQENEEEDADSHNSSTETHVPSTDPGTTKSKQNFLARMAVSKKSSYNLKNKLETQPAVSSKQQKQRRQLEKAPIKFVKQGPPAGWELLRSLVALHLEGFAKGELIDDYMSTSVGSHDIELSSSESEENSTDSNESEDEFTLTKNDDYYFHGNKRSELVGDFRLTSDWQPLVNTPNVSSGSDYRMKYNDTFCSSMNGIDLVRRWIPTGSPSIHATFNTMPSTNQLSYQKFSQHVGSIPVSNNQLAGNKDLLSSIFHSSMKTSLNLRSAAILGHWTRLSDGRWSNSFLEDELKIVLSELQRRQILAQVRKTALMRRIVSLWKTNNPKNKDKNTGTFYGRRLLSQPAASKAGSTVMNALRKLRYSVLTRQLPPSLRTSPVVDQMKSTLTDSKKSNSHRLQQDKTPYHTNMKQQTKDKLTDKNYSLENSKHTSLNEEDENETPDLKEIMRVRVRDWEMLGVRPIFVWRGQEIDPFIFSLAQHAQLFCKSYTKKQGNKEVENDTHRITYSKELLDEMIQRIQPQQSDTSMMEFDTGSKHKYSLFVSSPEDGWYWIAEIPADHRYNHMRPEIMDRKTIRSSSMIRLGIFPDQISAALAYDTAVRHRRVQFGLHVDPEYLLIDARHQQEQEETIQAKESRKQKKLEQGYSDDEISMNQSDIDSDSENDLQQDKTNLAYQQHTMYTNFSLVGQLLEPPPHLRIARRVWPTICAPKVLHQWEWLRDQFGRTVRWRDDILLHSEHKLYNQLDQIDEEEYLSHGTVKNNGEVTYTSLILSTSNLLRPTGLWCLPSKWDNCLHNIGTTQRQTETEFEDDMDGIHQTSLQSLTRQTSSNSRRRRSSVDPMVHYTFSSGQLKTFPSSSSIVSSSASGMVESERQYSLQAHRRFSVQSSTSTQLHAQLSFDEDPEKSEQITSLYHVIDGYKSFRNIQSICLKDVSSVTSSPIQKSRLNSADKYNNNSQNSPRLSTHSHRSNHILSSSATSIGNSIQEYRNHSRHTAAQSIKSRKGSTVTLTSPEIFDIFTPSIDWMTDDAHHDDKNIINESSTTSIVKKEQLIDTTTEKSSIRNVIYPPCLVSNMARQKAAHAADILRTRGQPAKTESEWYQWRRKYRSLLIQSLDTWLTQTMRDAGPQGQSEELELQRQDDSRKVRQFAKQSFRQTLAHYEQYASFRGSELIDHIVQLRLNYTGQNKHPISSNHTTRKSSSSKKSFSLSIRSQSVASRRVLIEVLDELRGIPGWAESDTKSWFRHRSLLPRPYVYRVLEAYQKDLEQKYKVNKVNSTSVSSTTLNKNSSKGSKTDITAAVVAGHERELEQKLIQRKQIAYASLYLLQTSGIPARIAVAGMTTAPKRQNSYFGYRIPTELQQNNRNDISKTTNELDESDSSVEDTSWSPNLNKQVSSTIHPVALELAHDMQLAADQMKYGINDSETSKQNETDMYDTRSIASGTNSWRSGLNNKTSTKSFRRTLRRTHMKLTDKGELVPNPEYLADEKEMIASPKTGDGFSMNDLLSDIPYSRSASQTESLRTKSERSQPSTFMLATAAQVKSRGIRKQKQLEKLEQKSRKLAKKAGKQAAQMARHIQLARARNRIRGRWQQVNMLGLARRIDRDLEEKNCDSLHDTKTKQDTDSPVAFEELNNETSAALKETMTHTDKQSREERRRNLLNALFGMDQSKVEQRSAPNYTHRDLPMNQENSLISLVDAAAAYTYATQQTRWQNSPRYLFHDTQSLQDVNEIQEKRIYRKKRRQSVPTMIHTQSMIQYKLKRSYSAPNFGVKRNALADYIASLYMADRSNHLDTSDLSLRSSSSVNSILSNLSAFEPMFAANPPLAPQTPMAVRENLARTFFDNKLADGTLPEGLIRDTSSVSLLPSDDSEDDLSSSRRLIRTQSEFLAYASLGRQAYSLPELSEYQNPNVIRVSEPISQRRRAMAPDMTKEQKYAYTVNLLDQEKQRHRRPKRLPIQQRVAYLRRVQSAPLLNRADRFISSFYGLQTQDKGYFGISTEAQSIAMDKLYAFQEAIRNRTGISAVHDIMSSVSKAFADHIVHIPTAHRVSHNRSNNSLFDTLLYSTEKRDGHPSFVTRTVSHKALHRMAKKLSNQMKHHSKSMPYFNTSDPHYKRLRSFAAKEFEAAQQEEHTQILEQVLNLERLRRNIVGNVSRHVFGHPKGTGSYDMSKIDPSFDPTSETNATQAYGTSNMNPTSQMRFQPFHPKTSIDRTSRRFYSKFSRKTQNTFNTGVSHSNSTSHVENPSNFQSQPRSNTMQETNSQIPSQIPSQIASQISSQIPSSSGWATEPWRVLPAPWRPLMSRDFDCIVGTGMQLQPRPSNQTQLNTGHTSMPPTTSQTYDTVFDSDYVRWLLGDDLSADPALIAELMRAPRGHHSLRQSRGRKGHSTMNKASLLSMMANQARAIHSSLAARPVAHAIIRTDNVHTDTLPIHLTRPVVYDSIRQLKLQTQSDMNVRARMYQNQAVRRQRYNSHATRAKNYNRARKQNTRNMNYTIHNNIEKQMNSSPNARQIQGDNLVRYFTHNANNLVQSVSQKTNDQPINHANVRNIMLNTMPQVNNSFNQKNRTNPNQISVNQPRNHIEQAQLSIEQPVLNSSNKLSASISIEAMERSINSSVPLLVKRQSMKEFTSAQSTANKNHLRKHGSTEDTPRTIERDTNNTNVPSRPSGIQPQTRKIIHRILHTQDTNNSNKHQLSTSNLDLDNSHAQRFFSIPTVLHTDTHHTSISPKNNMKQSTFVPTSSVYTSSVPTSLQISSMSSLTNEQKHLMSARSMITIPPKEAEKQNSVQITKNASITNPMAQSQQDVECFDSLQSSTKYPIMPSYSLKEISYPDQTQTTYHTATNEPRRKLSESQSTKQRTPGMTTNSKQKNERNDSIQPQRPTKPKGIVRSVHLQHATRLQQSIQRNLVKLEEKLGKHSTEWDRLHTEQKELQGSIPEKTRNKQLSPSAATQTQTMVLQHENSKQQDMSKDADNALLSALRRKLRFGKRRKKRTLRTNASSLDVKKKGTMMNVLPNV